MNPCSRARAGREYGKPTTRAFDTTFSNVDAPTGTQAGFVQITGSLSQPITIAEGGWVTVSLQAAQRMTEGQRFTVSLGSTIVGTFIPAGPAYQSFATSPIQLAAGTYDLTFTGLNPNGGDSTAFLDSIQVTVASSASGATWDPIADFTVDASTATSANGAWQYGLLPDLTSPATSFALYTLSTPAYDGVVSFPGYYASPPGAGYDLPILMCNQTAPPATIVDNGSSVPVGFLFLHPGTAGQYSALRFVAPAAGSYSVTGTFEGTNSSGTTTDVHVLKISGSTSTSLASGIVDGYYGGDGGSPSGPSPFVPFALSDVALEAGDSLLFAVGSDGPSFFSDSTGLALGITLVTSDDGGGSTDLSVLAPQISTYTYDGNGLRRSTQEAGAATPTTFIWDGTDYLMEKS